MTDFERQGRKEANEAYRANVAPPTVRELVRCPSWAAYPSATAEDRKAFAVAYLKTWRAIQATEKATA